MDEEDLIVDALNYALGVEDEETDTLDVVGDAVHHTLESFPDLLYDTGTAFLFDFQEYTQTRLNLALSFLVYAYLCYGSSSQQKDLVPGWPNPDYLHLAHQIMADQKEVTADPDPRFPQYTKNMYIILEHFDLVNRILGNTLTELFAEERKGLQLGLTSPLGVMPVPVEHYNHPKRDHDLLFDHTHHDRETLAIKSIADFPDTTEPPQPRQQDIYVRFQQIMLNSPGPFFENPKAVNYLWIHFIYYLQTAFTADHSLAFHLRREEARHFDGNTITPLSQRSEDLSYGFRMIACSAAVNRYHRLEETELSRLEQELQKEALIAAWSRQLTGLVVYTEEPLLFDVEDEFLLRGLADVYGFIKDMFLYYKFGDIEL